MDADLQLSVSSLIQYSAIWEFLVLEYPLACYVVHRDRWGNVIVCARFVQCVCVGGGMPTTVHHSECNPSLLLYSLLENTTDSELEDY